MKLKKSEIDVVLAVGIQGEWRCTVTSRWMKVVSNAPRPHSPPGKNLGTHFIVGCVGPRPRLDDFGKKVCYAQRDLNPGSTSLIAYAFDNAVQAVSNKLFCVLQHEGFHSL